MFRAALQMPLSGVFVDTLKFLALMRWPGVFCKLLVVQCFIDF